MESVNNSPGKMKVKIVKAELTRDTEMFSEMDPFCQMTYKKCDYKTQTHQEGGKKPKWNREFEIHVDNINDPIKFWVGEKDLTWDDDVGTAELTVKDIIGEGLNGKDDWYGIQYKGEPSGKI